MSDKIKSIINIGKVKFINNCLPRSQPFFGFIVYKCYFLFYGALWSVWLIYKPTEDEEEEEGEEKKQKGTEIRRELNNLE
uniref:Uncharacterized protein n=1 Tax=Schistosoma haematobium TaxID=6185 RepID=A0A095A3F5_SCHHA